MTFTIFAAFSLGMVAKTPKYVFWLGIAAHMQILVGMTALGWTLGRRMVLSGGKAGVTISDSEVAINQAPPAKPEETVE